MLQQFIITTQTMQTTAKPQDSQEGAGEPTGEVSALPYATYSKIKTPIKPIVASLCAVVHFYPIVHIIYLQGNVLPLGGNVSFCG
mmetsp:Transcript_2977/g.4016  ORF Transcript_2977/g.4016 Transcript_2977/m.4016 type:complete len:85 (-) Transcript_2977:147-401(-)